jgi:hypothetical protein
MDAARREALSARDPLGAARRAAGPALRRCAVAHGAVHGADGCDREALGAVLMQH